MSDLTAILDSVELESNSGVPPTNLQRMQDMFAEDPNQQTYSDWGLTDNDVKEVKLTEFLSKQLDVPPQEIQSNFKTASEAFAGKIEPITINEQWNTLKGMLGSAETPPAPISNIGGTAFRPMPQTETPETKVDRGLQDYKGMLANYFKNGVIPKNILKSRVGTGDYIWEALKQGASGVCTSMFGTMAGIGRLAGEQNIIGTRAGVYGRSPAKLTGHELAKVADDLLDSTNEVYGFNKNMASLMADADSLDLAFWTNGISNLAGFMLPAATMQMMTAGAVNASAGMVLGSLGKTKLTGHMLSVLSKSKAGRILTKVAPQALQSAVPAIILGAIGATSESLTEAGTAGKTIIDEGGTLEQAGLVAQKVFNRNMGLLNFTNSLQIGLGTIPFKNKIWNLATGVIDMLLEPFEELSQDMFSSTAIAEILPMLADKYVPEKRLIDFYDVIHNREKRDLAFLCMIPGLKDYAVGGLLRTYEKARVNKATAQELFQKKVVAVKSAIKEQERLNNMPADSKSDIEKEHEKILNQHIKDKVVDDVFKMAEELEDATWQHNEEQARKIQEGLVEQQIIKNERYAQRKQDIEIKQGINELLKYHRRNGTDLLEISGMKPLSLQEQIDKELISVDRADSLREGAGYPADKPFNEIFRGGRNFIVSTEETAKYMVELAENEDSEQAIQNIGHEISESRFKKEGDWSKDEQRFMNNEYNAMVEDNRAKFDSRHPDLKTTQNNLEWLSDTAMKYSLAEEVDTVYPAGTFTAKFKRILDGIREYMQTLLKGSKEIVEMVQSGQFTEDFVQELRKGARGELEPLYVQKKAIEEPAVIEAENKIDEVVEEISKNPQMPEPQPEPQPVSTVPKLQKGSFKIKKVGQAWKVVVRDFYGEVAENMVYPTEAEAQESIRKWKEKLSDKNFKEVKEYWNKEKDIEDLLRYISVLSSSKIFHDKTDMGTAVNSIMGGNDLTFKAKGALQEIKFILDSRPDLINLVPHNQLPLVLEYIKQNLSNRYADIIYNKIKNNLYDEWYKGNLQKERATKSEIFKIVNDEEETEALFNEIKEKYGNPSSGKNDGSATHKIVNNESTLTPVAPPPKNEPKTGDFTTNDIQGATQNNNVTTRNIAPKGGVKQNSQSITKAPPQKNIHPTENNDINSVGSENSKTTDLNSKTPESSPDNTDLNNPAQINNESTLTPVAPPPKNEPKTGDFREGVKQGENVLDNVTPALHYPYNSASTALHQTTPQSTPQRETVETVVQDFVDGKIYTDEMIAKTDKIRAEEKENKTEEVNNISEKENNLPTFTDEEIATEVEKAGLPPKMIAKIKETLTDRARAIEYLHRENKQSKKIWSNLTGFKLPASNKGTKEQIDRFFNGEQPSVPKIKPKKEAFYIYSQKLGKYKKQMGVKVESINPNVNHHDFFVNYNKDDKRYVVTEARTGMGLGSSIESEEKAIESFNRNMEREDIVDFLQNSINTFLKDKEESPYYKFKKTAVENQEVIQSINDKGETENDRAENDTGGGDRQVSAERSAEREEAGNIQDNTAGGQSAGHGRIKDTDVSNTEQTVGTGVSDAGLPNGQNEVEGQPAINPTGRSDTLSQLNEVVQQTATDNFIPESEQRHTENYNLQEKPVISLTKAERRVINKRALEILDEFDAGKELTEEDKNILRQFTGEGGLGAKSKESLNQHYTDYKLIRAIYSAIEGAGFKLNNKTKALEPSAGSGNFLGNRPELDWTTTEIDETNHRILNALYPDAKHYFRSFEDHIQQDLDLVISNVPFLQERTILGRRTRPDVKALHDFFFVHGIDRVKPNGVVAFVTSTGTMGGSSDAKVRIRKELMDKADVIGAFRLPSSQFEANADTSVITDLIFLQKRPDGAVPSADQLKKNNAFVTVTKKELDGEPYFTPTYYEENPENVLGESFVSKDKAKFGKIILQGKGDIDLTDIQIQKQNYNYKAPKKEPVKVKSDIPTDSMDFMVWIGRNRITARLSEKDNNFQENLFIDGDKVFIKDKIVNFTDTQQKAKIYTELKGEQADKILDLEKISKYAKDFQATKNQGFVYEAMLAIEDYQNKYKKAPVSDRELKKLFKDNNALEYFFEYQALFDKDFNTADVFKVQTRFTGQGVAKITEDSVLRDRAFASENNNGEFEVTYATKNNKSHVKKEEITELLKQGYSVAEITKNGIKLQNDIFFYSGMVYTKIDKVNEAIAEIEQKQTLSNFDTDILNNLKLELVNLNSVLPDPYTVDQIVIKGSEDYFYPYLKGHATSFNIRKEYDKVSGKATFTSSDSLLQNHMNNYKLIRHDSDLTDLQNWENMQRAQKQLREVLQLLKNEIKRNPGLKKNIEDAYNKKLRGYVRPDYKKARYIIQPILDEISLNTNGQIALRKNQEDWMLKAYIEGRGINAHDVGLGKTFAAIALARALKTKGIANKPLFVVPSKTIVKWITETKLLFPDAKVFDLGKLPEHKRQEMLNKISNTDADYTYISLEGFKNIDMSLKSDLKFYGDLAADLILNEEKASSGKLTKSQEKKLALLRMKVDSFMKYIKSKPRDVKLTFESLGFDCVIADEAHSYKNIGLPSRLSSAGLGAQSDLKISPAGNVTLGSQRSYDFRIKANYIAEENNGRNVFLLTATPFSNKPLEVYTMLRHLGTQVFEEYGIKDATDFVNSFFEIGSVPSNSGRPKEVLTHIKNAIELKSLMDRYIDIKDASDTPDIVIPKGDYIDVGFSTSPEYDMIAQQLKIRLDEVKAKQPSEYEDEKGKVTKDNIMTIFGDSRRASIDPRLLFDSKFMDMSNISPLRSGNPEYDKIQYTIDAVYKSYKENPMEGQLIFLDATGESLAKNNKLDMDLYEEIKQGLIEKGMKPKQIAIVSGSKFTNYNTGKEVTSMYDKDEDGVRVKIDKDQAKYNISELYNGEYDNKTQQWIKKPQFKVVLGSTSSIGEGMNFNRTTTRIYNLDIPFVPGAFVQREGRGLRQGNLNDYVKIFKMFAVGSFDNMSYQIITKKLGWQSALNSRDLQHTIDVSAEMAEGGMPDQQALAITLENDIYKKLVLMKEYQLSLLEKNSDQLDTATKTAKTTYELTELKIADTESKLSSYAKTLDALVPDMKIKDVEKRTEAYERSKNHYKKWKESAEGRLVHYKQALGGQKDFYELRKSELQSAIQKIAEYKKDNMDGKKFIISDLELQTAEECINNREELPLDYMDKVGKETFNLQPTSRKALSYIKQWDKVNEQQKVFERYGATEYAEEAQKLKDSIIKDIERITGTQADSDQTQYIRQVKKDANMNTYEKQEMATRPRTIGQISEDLKLIRSQFNSDNYKKGGDAIRKDIIRLQKELEPYLATLPAKERGKLYKRTRILAERKTPAGQLAMLNNSIAMVDRILNRVERKELLATIDKMIKAGGTTVKGGRATSKTTSATSTLVDRIKAIIGYDTSTVDRKINELINESENKDNAELSDKEMEELLLLNTFGDLENKNIKELREASKELESIVTKGRFLRYMLELEYRQAIAGDRNNVISIIAPEGLLEGTSNLHKDRTKRGKYWWKLLAGIEAFRFSNLSFEWSMNALSRKDENSAHLDSFLNKTYARKVHRAEQYQNTRIREREYDHIQAMYNVFGIGKKDKFKNRKLIKAFKAFTKREETDIILNVYKDETLLRDKTIEEMIKDEMGITEEVEKQPPLVINQDEAVYLWLCSQQEDVFVKMLKTGWTDEAFVKLEEFMTPQAYAYANWLQEEYRNEYDSMNEVYKKLFWADMPQITNYAPTVYEYAKSNAKDFTIESMASGGAIGVSPNPLSIMKRVDHTKPIRVMSASKVFLKSVYESEHFKAYGTLSKELNAVFKNEKTQMAITQSFGTAKKRMFNTILDNNIRGGMPNERIFRTIDGIRSFITKAILAFKFVNFFKQASSLPAYAMDMSTKDLAYYTAEFMKNPIKNIREMYNLDFVKNRMYRGYSKDLRVAQAQLEGKPKNWFNAILDAGMMPTKLGDVMPILIGYYAVYNTQLKENLKSMPRAEAEREAHLSAEMASERTQQASGIKDLGWMQQQGSALNLFQMFISAQRQYANATSEIIADAIAGKKGARLVAAKKIILTSVILPILFQAMGDAFKLLFDDEYELQWEDYAVMCIFSPFQGYILAGQMLNFFGRKAFGLYATYEPIAGTNLVEDGYKTVEDICEGEKDPLQIMEQILKPTGLGTTIKTVNRGFSD